MSYSFIYLVTEERNKQEGGGRCIDDQVLHNLLSPLNNNGCPKSSRTINLKSFYMKQFTVLHLNTTYIQHIHTHSIYTHSTYT